MVPTPYDKPELLTEWEKRFQELREAGQPKCRCYEHIAHAYGVAPVTVYRWLKKSSINALHHRARLLTSSQAPKQRNAFIPPSQYIRLYSMYELPKPYPERIRVTIEVVE